MPQVKTITPTSERMRGVAIFPRSEEWGMGPKHNELCISLECEFKSPVDLLNQMLGGVAYSDRGYD